MIKNVLITSKLGKINVSKNYLPISAPFCNVLIMNTAYLKTDQFSCRGRDSPWWRWVCASSGRCAGAAAARAAARAAPPVRLVRARASNCSRLPRVLQLILGLKWKKKNYNSFTPNNYLFAYKL